MVLPNILIDSMYILLLFLDDDEFFKFSVPPNILVFVVIASIFEGKIISVSPKTLNTFNVEFFSILAELKSKLRCPNTSLV